ncbi:hypothetical protein Thimo_1773 [Thioflavicoccus mobilis 8321]|uniref:DUF5681 domain-containing protein n=1 Tax=Thioflavicoccus mobilis 8321 TaxID=765912 RepID=L0GYU5_9GAMM|nr:DUF5681 domain-containing protein [Thioflavicoccus mobilis]AGA90545.1 hypothetical protein Thimo_1773 [Thioflavicoccus mobilis 8321]
MARYKPGESGNPSGKPRGAVSKTTKLRRSIERDLPDILSALVAQAKEGDVQAAKLLVDRCLPALRPVDAPTPVQLGDTLTEHGQSVMAALSTGQLGVSQAASLLAALSALAKIIETDELTRRVEQLEKARTDEH